MMLLAFSAVAFLVPVLVVAPVIVAQIIGMKADMLRMGIAAQQLIGPAVSLETHERVLATAHARLARYEWWIRVLRCGRRLKTSRR